jgi:hypothetical protein
MTNTWKVSTANKKSVVGVHYFTKDDQLLTITTRYRWGSIYTHIEPTFATGELSETEIPIVFPDFEIFDLDDEISLDFNWEDLDIPDAEQYAIEDGWNESASNYMESAGWEYERWDLTFYGPLTIEKVNNA